MGAGPAPGWEENWEQVPLACEETWQVMEQLSSGSYDDVSSLEQGVVSLKAPSSDWAAIRAGSDLVKRGLLRNRMSGPPSTTFIGGAPEDCRHVVFRRPLKSTDFINLWSNEDIEEVSP